MRFYKMMNGDIVTGLQLVMGSNTLKGTKVFDAEKQKYCFTSTIYSSGVKERLNRAQKTVLMNQLNLAIALKDEGSIYSDPLHRCVTIDRPPFRAWKHTGWITKWRTHIKETIHDYTK